MIRLEIGQELLKSGNGKDEKEKWENMTSLIGKRWDRKSHEMISNCKEKNKNPREDFRKERAGSFLFREQQKKNSISAVCSPIIFSCKMNSEDSCVRNQH